MKKIIYSILVSLSILSSCEKTGQVLDEKKQLISKKADIGSISNGPTINPSIQELDWTGIPINFLMERGISNNKKFLSTTDSGGLIDLLATDDNSGRQRWLLEPTTSGNYNIRVYSGVYTNKQILSASSDGLVVDLWHQDDASGRQRWNFQPLGNDIYHIMIQGGISNSKSYLSSTGTGDKVDLWTTDDASGRQQWKIQAAGEFDLINVEYSLGPGDEVISKPNFVTSMTLNNSTSVNQQMNVNFTTKAAETSNFSQTTGISVKLSTTLKVSVPFIASANVTTDLTTSGSWTYGGSQTKEDSQSYSFTAVVPANKTVIAKAVVAMKQISTNYIATFRHQGTGAIKKIQGRWTGIQASSVYYELVEMQTGAILATYQ